MGKLNRRQNGEEKREEKIIPFSKTPSKKEKKKNSKKDLYINSPEENVNRENLPAIQPVLPSKKEGKEKKKDELLPFQKEMMEEIEWRDREVARVFREGRNRVGRPTKLTEELIRDMEVLERIGLSETAICESVCISEETLNKWRKKYPEFSERLNKARNKGKSLLVNSLYGHGLRNWQATAWLLERMHRKEFALDRAKVELTGKDSGPIVFEVVYVKKKTEEV